MLVSLVFYICAFVFNLSCHQDEKGTQTLKEIVPLPHELDECSGMILFNNATYAAINDGGNKPILYVFNLKNSSATKKILISNVANNDWEEVKSDDQYIYIGDTGNNGGTRQNLAIYKAKIDDVLGAGTVNAEKINFRYEGQTKFNDSNRHNFDCEAFVVVGDSIYLFSKNRGDLGTDVYVLPNSPGSYAARKLDSFNAKGLITGADYRINHGKPELALIGYSISNHVYSPFLIHFTNFRGTQFFKGTSHRITINRKLQAESVLFHDDQTVYISNEESKYEKGFIYGLSLNK